jgi:hypothetical protein
MTKLVGIERGGLSGRGPICSETDLHAGDQPYGASCDGHEAMTVETRPWIIVANAAP